MLILYGGVDVIFFEFNYNFFVLKIKWNVLKLNYKGYCVKCVFIVYIKINLYVYKVDLLRIVL